MRLTSDSAALQSVYWHLGVEHFHLGQFENASTAFHEAWRRDTNDLHALSLAAVATAELGNFAGALSYWNTVLRIDPAYFDKASTYERDLFRLVKSAKRK